MRFIPLLLLCACATTRIELRGEFEIALDPQAIDQMQTSIVSTLTQSRVFDNSNVTIDRRFERDGFSKSSPSLKRIDGEERVLFARSKEANTTLMLRLQGLGKGPQNLDETVPYLVHSARAHGRRFVALCKGGRGRVLIRLNEEQRLQGDLLLTLHCRTYVDSLEQDEIQLKLEGPFSAPVRAP